MEAYLDGKPDMVFDLQVRLDYIRYCIPDRRCSPDWGLEVLEVGPYAPNKLLELEDTDQTALEHILRCSRWERLWEPVTSFEGPELSEERRQRLWWEAIPIQGLAGMEVVTLKDGSGVRKWAHRLREIRVRIHRLSEKDKPKVVRGGAESDVEVSKNVPDLYREIDAGCWSRTKPQGVVYECSCQHFGRVHQLSEKGKRKVAPVTRR